MSDYRKDTLANGLRVVTVEMPHLHSVEMACYVGVGSRHEPAELAGISHFLEHMLFRGTSDYASSTELERAFEAIGGNVNASTDAETTCYHSRLHPAHVAEGARLFASMLRRPLYRDLETERRIILEEALEDLNEQGEEINPDNLTACLLWPGHPLGVPTIGRQESIAAVTQAQLQDFHRHYYRPQNVVLAVGGRVRHAEVLAAVEAAFGDWAPGGGRGAVELPPPTVADQRALWVRDTGSQVTLQLAFQVPGRHGTQGVPLRLLRALLSWGGASRLMLRLREELGLVYSVEANLSLYRDTGCFSVEMAVTPENLLKAVEETSRVFAELRHQPVDRAELVAAVRAYQYDLEFSCDYTDAMALRYGWGELVGYVRSVAQDMQELAEVSADELLATAVELFVPQRLVAAFVGPYRDGDRQAVESVLAGFGG